MSTNGHHGHLSSFEAKGERVRDSAKQAREATAFGYLQAFVPFIVDRQTRQQNAGSLNECKQKNEYKVEANAPG